MPLCAIAPGLLRQSDLAAGIDGVDHRYRVAANQTTAATQAMATMESTTTG